MPRRLLVFTIFLLAACLPIAPSHPARTVDAGERLLNEDYTTGANWSIYDTDAYAITVAGGVYRMLGTTPGQYIYGTNRQQYDNTIVDVDVTWLSDNPDAITGVICRLHPGSGQGYYIVVSASGDFSIRYITRNIDDAILRWRGDSGIPRSGSFTMRVICVDDFIALYINDKYIDGAEDSRLRDGQLALAAGLPGAASQGDLVMVEFDNLRIWEASFP